MRWAAEAGRRLLRGDAELLTASVWVPPVNCPGAAAPALIGVSLLNWGVASLYSS